MVFLRKTLYLSIHMLNYIFAIGKSKTHSCTIVIIRFLYFPKQLKHLFLVFLWNTHPCIFHCELECYISQNLIFIEKLFLYRIKWFCFLYFDWNIYSSLICVLYRVWNKIEKYILYFIRITIQLIWYIFININF
jgi:hypothetical protein